MLVLSRKENERLLIGEEIEITVVRVSGNRVKLGIKAPKTVAIRREELDAENCPSNPPITPVEYELAAAGIA